MFGAGDGLVAVQVMPPAMQELLIASVTITSGSERLRLLMQSPRLGLIRPPAIES